MDMKEDCRQKTMFAFAFARLFLTLASPIITQIEYESI